MSIHHDLVDRVAHDAALSIDATDSGRERPAHAANLSTQTGHALSTNLGDTRKEPRIPAGIAGSAARQVPSLFREETPSRERGLTTKPYVFA